MTSIYFKCAYEYILILHYITEKVNFFKDALHFFAFFKDALGQYIKAACSPKIISPKC